MKKEFEFDFNTRAIKVYDTGVDSRKRARFHVRLVLGATSVSVLDTRFLPVERTLDMDADVIVTEENYVALFAEACQSLVESGNMAGDELAACVTYPEGTTVATTPLPDGVN
jgi:hypothetical protein